MYKDFAKADVVIGISACLIGEKVRFDASNKPLNVCIKALGQYVTYKAYCPEVAVDLDSSLLNCAPQVLFSSTNVLKPLSRVA